MLPIGSVVLANDPDGRVTGSFYVLSGEMESLGFPKLWRRGSAHIPSWVRGLTTASHETQLAKSMANAGVSADTGLVAGAWQVSQVFQTR